MFIRRIFNEDMHDLDLLDLINEIIEEELSLDEMDPNYLKGLSGEERAARRREIEYRKNKRSSDPSAYGPFKTDKTPSGKPRGGNKESVWTRKAREMGFGPDKQKKKTKKEATEHDEEFLLEDFDLEVLREFINEAILDEKKKRKGNNVTKALKNKAEKSGAPMSALRAIYNKGLAAWRTGHRPGASQHAWAMARVNSVLAGGPARKVDAAQWKQIQKHRGKKRKKK